MRHFFVTLLVFVSGSMAFAQAPPIAWQHTYGGSDYDIAHAVIATADGGYITAGVSWSDDGDVTYAILAGDAWLVKTDFYGNIQWQNSYGGIGSDEADAVRQTKDHGYIFAGTTYSTDLHGYHDEGDILVGKTDSAGNLLWQKCYGGSKVEMGADIQQTSDGGYIVVGNTGSIDGDVTGFHGGTGGDVWIIKLDDTGGLQWQRTYGGTAWDYATSVLQTADSGYMVAALTISDSGDVTHHYGLYDAWILKLKPTGELVWQKTYGGSGFDAANCIRQTADGAFIFAGNTASTDGDVTYNRGGPLYMGAVLYGDFWVVKIDDTGAIIWQQTYGGTGDEEGNSLALTLDGGYVVTGWTESNDDQVTGYRDSTDIWVLKIDDTGALQWQETLGGTQSDIAYSILQSADSSYLVAGRTTSFNGDVTYNHGLQDYWLVKLGKKVNATPLINAPDAIEVYPTVTDGNVQVVLPLLNEDAIFSMTNMLGQKVNLAISSTGQIYTIQIDRSAPEGMYVLQVNRSGVLSSFKILLKK